jgi:hypothetical protein
MMPLEDQLIINRPMVDTLKRALETALCSSTVPFGAHPSGCRPN